MRRRRLKAMLDKAELRMFEGAWRVARQRERVAEMSGRGVDMRPYWELLAQFEETQRLHVKHVQQIKRSCTTRRRPEASANPLTSTPPRPTDDRHRSPA